MSNDNRSLTSNINPEFNPKSVNLTLNEKSVKRHIKRLGKVLQDNEWIELKKSLSHTQLQEMFAEILGFNNYHEFNEVLKHNAQEQEKNHNKPGFDDDSHLIANMAQLNQEQYRLPENKDKIITEIEGVPLAEIEQANQLYFSLNHDNLPHTCKWFDFTLSATDLKKGTGVLLLLLLKMSEKESVRKLNIFSHLAIKENRDALLGYEVELNRRITDNHIFNEPVFIQELIEAVKTTQIGEGKEAVYQLNHLLPLMNKFLHKISHLVQLNTPAMTAIADFYNMKNKLK